MEYDYSNVQALVLDNGSGMMKAGFAGDDAPRAVFPTVIGRPKAPGILIGMGSKPNYVGDEALAKRGLLNFTWPVQRGLFPDVQEMEHIWHHTFYPELSVAPEEHPVLVTESVDNPKHDRQKMIEILFEIFNVPAAYVTNPGLLALIASGRRTGIVLDIGHGASHAVPVYEEHTLPYAHQRLNMAGNDITSYLLQLLEGKQELHDASFTPSQTMAIVTDIKEKLGYVSLDYNSDVKVNYLLPDQRTIELGTEVYRCTEALFQPSLAGIEGVGIHELIFDSIMKCDTEIQPILFNNIVLEGGTCMLPGIKDRLEKELAALVPSDTKIRVIRPPECKYSSWIGGSILASLASFQTMWIGYQEYKEYGSSIVHRKCF